MEILLILIVSALNIACFFIGAKVGQTVSRDEKLALPSVNPIKAVREHHERREAERARERVDTILRNIESYDGTGAHQEDVPRR